MKVEAKRIIQEWKPILEQFLDPRDLLDALPNEFPLGSPQYHKVYQEHKSPHIAVHNLLEIILNGNMHFQEFITAIRKCDHHWLATLVSGEIEDEEVEKAILQRENLAEVRRILTLIAPHIRRTIVAIDVADHLYIDGVITGEDFEVVEAVARTDGNQASVRALLSILARKPPGWWKKFACIIRELNYDIDLVNSFETLTMDEKPVQYASSDVAEEPDFLHESISKDDMARPSSGAIPKRNASMAANFSPRASKMNDSAHRKNLRTYQQVLARDAILGKNVIICAPTGSGKTRVASHIIYSRFNEILESKEPKVAFIVPRVALAKQQHDNIKSYLSEDTWHTDYLVGNKNSTLKSALRSSSVIVMTPQILMNALDDGSLSSLTRFSMIVFDECHHTMKENPYNIIMSRYLDLKQKGNRELPQIVGLTATLGVGKGKLDSAAVEHMLTLCANLDATGGIVTVPLEHQDELSDFTPQPSEENISLDSDVANDPFNITISDAIDEVVRILYGKDLRKIKGATRPHPLLKGSQQYIQWCQDFLHKANASLTGKSDTDLCRDVQTCVDYISIFNGALDLSLKCRPVDAVKFLKKQTNLSYDVNLSPIDGQLRKLALKCCRRLEELQDDPRCANPKLKKMEAEIISTFRNDRNSRVMLNVLKRQYAEPIRDWLNESPELLHLYLKAEYFTGVGKSKDGSTSGLTHNKQEQILDLFRQGVIKVLVCTPEVASEGMDIVDCNLVICYDYVKNEISKTQVKGRARKKEGRMVQFSSRNVMARDKANISKILLMDKTTLEIQKMFKNDPDRYLKELERLQKSAILNARLKRRLSEGGAERKNTSSNKYRVLCKKCSLQACMGDDIEVLGTMHTFDEKEYKDRFKKKVVEHGGTEQKKGLFCIGCNSQWGIFTKFRDITIPLLKPDAFKFVSDNDPDSPQMGKQWSNIKIKFKDVTYEDLAERQI